MALGADSRRRFSALINFRPAPATSTPTRPAAKSWLATDPSQPFKAFPASLCRPSTLTRACRGKTPSTLLPATGLAALPLPLALRRGSAAPAAVAVPVLGPAPAAPAVAPLRKSASSKRTRLWLMGWPSSASSLQARLYPRLASSDNWRRRSSTVIAGPGCVCVAPCTSSLGSSTRIPVVPSARSLKNGSTMAKLVPWGSQAWASQMFVTRGALYTARLDN
mmetsp:Transcript_56580/g.166112  ORF Transcript_56580/g.166112 Transcript_56580/m.166112 type:complete len:221 (+) Transcript_56580:878-1540(+)